jgi:hypothetical protein
MDNSAQKRYCKLEKLGCFVLFVVRQTRLQYVQNNSKLVWLEKWPMGPKSTCLLDSVPMPER